MGRYWRLGLLLAHWSFLGLWGTPAHDDSSPANRPSDSNDKPPLLYLYANKSEDFLLSQRAVMGALGQCFAVRDLDLGAVVDLPKTLEELSLPSDTPIVISGSHGWGYNGQAAEKLADFAIDPRGYNLRVAPILEALDARYPGNPKVMDICGAGICEGKAKCLAVGCEVSGKISVSPITQMSALESELVPLFCDSAKTCEKIKAMDTNNNGAADAEEINRYLIGKYGSKRQHIRTETFGTVGESEKMRQECRALAGEFATKEIKSSRLRLRVRGNKKSAEKIISDSVSLGMVRRGLQNLGGNLTVPIMELGGIIKRGKAIFRHALFSVDGFNHLNIKNIELAPGGYSRLQVTLETPAGDQVTEEWDVTTLWEEFPQHISTCRWGNLVPVLRVEGGEEQVPLFGDGFAIKCLKP